MHRLQVRVVRTGTTLGQLASFLLERTQNKDMLDVFGNVFVEKDQVLEWSRGQHRLDVLVQSTIGNEDRARAGVAKDKLDLFERLRRVNGDVDRAETEYREIGD